MIIFVWAVIGWSLACLFHLSLQPAYRRSAPYRFPLSRRTQRTLRAFFPLMSLILCSLYEGINGLFMWGFSGPPISILISILCMKRT